MSDLTLSVRILLMAESSSINWLQSYKQRERLGMKQDNQF